MVQTLTPVKNKTSSYSKTADQLKSNAVIGGARIDTMAGPQPKVVNPGSCMQPKIFIPQQRLNVGMDRWPSP